MAKRAKHPRRRIKVKGYVGLFRSTARGRPFEIYYRDAEDKARFLTLRWANTPEEAAFERLKIVASVKAERERMSRNGAHASVTLAELAAAHLARPHAWKPQTADVYERAVRVHIVPALGQTRVCDLATDDIADFIADPRARGYASSSVATYMLPAKAILKRAVRDDLIPHNPIDLLEREERPGPGNQRDRILRVGEIERLFEAGADDEALQWSVMLGALLGPRRSELLALDWSRVDFEAGMVEIRRQRHADRKTSTTKSTAGVRRIRPLYDDALGLMEALSRRWRATWIAAPRRGAHGVRRQRIRAKLIRQRVCEGAQGGWA
jgi:integrase